MSNIPSALPPSSTSPTQIAGQQTAPSTSVPPGPLGPMYTPAGAGSRTNTLAIVSLAAGIGSFVAHIVPGVGGFTVALIPVITGYMARKQIRETGESGMGMATPRIIITPLHMPLLLLTLIAPVFPIFVF